MWFCTIAERLADSRETIIILAEIVDTFKGSNITKCFNLYSGHHQLYMNRQILEWQCLGMKKQKKWGVTGMVGERNG